MNILTLGIGGLFALLSIAFISMLTYVILGNLKTGRRYRQGIASQLSKLRLARMLGIHGISERSYLHTQPILDVREQMKRCSECAQTDECDQLLETGVGNTGEFCDNDASLNQVKAKLDND